MKWFVNKINQLKVHAEKPWYPLLLALLAFLYHFFLVMPVDTLFVASSLIAPKRWFAFVIATTTGFTLGGTAFALLVQRYGISIVERFVPGIMGTAIWTQSEHWMHHYGALALGAFSIIPFALHPLVTLAGIEHMSLVIVALSLFSGRFVKYTVLGILCAYLPSKVPLSKGAEDLIRAEEKTDAK